MHRGFIKDFAFLDQDVAAAVAEFQPEQGIAGKNGEGGEAAAERRAEVIVVGRKRGGEDEAGGVVAFQPHPHGLGERELVVEKGFGFAQQVVIGHVREVQKTKEMKKGEEQLESALR